MILSSILFKDEALKSAKKSNPNARWWVKADACDIRSGLQESMAGKWAGDEDLGDNKLQELYTEYVERCKLVKNFKVGSKNKLKEACDALLSSLQEDCNFLTTGEQVSRKAYDDVLSKTNLSKNSLIELSWAHIGYEELQKKLANIKVTLSVMISCILTDDNSTVKKMIYDCKKQVCSYLKDLYIKKRTTATHLLTFMISDERRRSKPYAIPVRFVPYQSMTDEKMRSLENDVENQLKANGMVPGGKYITGSSVW